MATSEDPHGDELENTSDVSRPGPDDGLQRPDVDPPEHSDEIGAA